MENPRYFKPYKRSMHKLSERLFGWSMKSWSYFLIPYKEAFGLPFPSQFTILISFKPDKDSEVSFPIVSHFCQYTFNLHHQGVLFSLTDPESKQDNLSLNIGKDFMPRRYFHLVFIFANKSQQQQCSTCRV